MFAVCVCVCVCVAEQSVPHASSSPVGLSVAGSPPNRPGFPPPGIISLSVVHMQGRRERVQAPLKIFFGPPQQGRTG